MPRYNFVLLADRPPAHFIFAELLNPRRSDIRTRRLPAQLDNGADRSVIPASIAASLELPELDDGVLIAGLGGIPEVRTVYGIEVASPDLPRSV